MTGFIYLILCTQPLEGELDGDGSAVPHRLMQKYERGSQEVKSTPPVKAVSLVPCCSSTFFLHTINYILLLQLLELSISQTQWATFAKHSAKSTIPLNDHDSGVLLSKGSRKQRLLGVSMSSARQRLNGYTDSLPIDVQVKRGRADPLLSQMKRWRR